MSVDPQRKSEKYAQKNDFRLEEKQRRGGGGGASA